MNTLNPFAELLQLTDEVVALERPNPPAAEWPGLFDEGSHVTAVMPILPRTKHEREKLSKERQNISERLTQLESDALDEVAQYRGADDDFDPEAVREFARMLTALMNWETTFAKQYRTREEIETLMSPAGWGNEPVDWNAVAGKVSERFVEKLVDELESSMDAIKRQAKALERQRRIARDSENSANEKPANEKDAKPNTSDEKLQGNDDETEIPEIDLGPELSLKKYASAVEIDYRTLQNLINNGVIQGKNISCNKWQLSVPDLSTYTDDSEDLETIPKDRLKNKLNELFKAKSRKK